MKKWNYSKIQSSFWNSVITVSDSFPKHSFLGYPNWPTNTNIFLRCDWRHSAPSLRSIFEDGMEKWNYSKIQSSFWNSVITVSDPFPKHSFLGYPNWPTNTNIFLRCSRRHSAPGLRSIFEDGMEKWNYSKIQSSFWNSVITVSDPFPKHSFLGYPNWPTNTNIFLRCDWRPSAPGLRSIFEDGMEKWNYSKIQSSFWNSVITVSDPFPKHSFLGYPNWPTNTNNFLRCDWRHSAPGLRSIFEDGTEKWNYSKIQSSFWNSVITVSEPFPKYSFLGYPNWPTNTIIFLRCDWRHSAPGLRSIFEDGMKKWNYSKIQSSFWNSVITVSDPFPKHSFLGYPNWPTNTNIFLRCDWRHSAPSLRSIFEDGMEKWNYSKIQSSFWNSVIFVSDPFPKHSFLGYPNWPTNTKIFLRCSRRHSAPGLRSIFEDGMEKWNYSKIQSSFWNSVITVSDPFPKHSFLGYPNWPTNTNIFLRCDWRPSAPGLRSIFEDGMEKWNYSKIQSSFWNSVITVSDPFPKHSFLGYPNWPTNTNIFLRCDWRHSAPGLRSIFEDGMEKWNYSKTEFWNIFSKT